MLGNADSLWYPFLTCLSINSYSMIFISCLIFGIVNNTYQAATMGPAEPLKIMYPPTDNWAVYFDNTPWLTKIAWCSLKIAIPNCTIHIPSIDLYSSNTPSFPEELSIVFGKQYVHAMPSWDYNCIEKRATGEKGLSNFTTQTKVIVERFGPSFVTALVYWLHAPQMQTAKALTTSLKAPPCFTCLLSCKDDV